MLGPITNRVAPFRLSGFWEAVNRKLFDALPATAACLLLRELIREPASIGAICSSSALLAKRMAAWIGPEQEGWVIELGGGTGAITSALLQHGVANDKLIVIEKSKILARHLCQRFPGIRIVHGDAADIAMIVKGGMQVKAIVSGLPFRSLPVNAVKKITDSCARALGAEGRLIQFTYCSRTPSAWLATGLIQAASETVWLNLPPARIEIFTHADICPEIGQTGSDAEILASCTAPAVLQATLMGCMDGQGIQ